tara:strand:+ start:1556 stop:2032 length:477 start_codon:yes stop_codon:yes gene_type:complete
MNWFNVDKIRPRKKKKIQPPNIFEGETREDVDPSKKTRVMGRGLMEDEEGNWMDAVRANTPIADRHKEVLQRQKDFTPEMGTRLGSKKAKEGEVKLVGGPMEATKPKAIKTMPKNKCAMCGRMLGARNRFTIDYGKSAKGKQIDLTFCRNCAERMSKE